MLVLATGVLGLAWPPIGIALSAEVTPLLAVLMLAVSLTFDVQTLRMVLRRPGLQALATVLVYGPMSLLGVLIAGAAFGSGPLWLGMILVGTLPTDVSSPLLVWIARGNVALATVCNAVNTALAPLLVPALFLLYTGVDLEVPVGGLISELALTVLLPTLIGVGVRTWQPGRVTAVEPVLSATGSVTYLLLLLAVVGPNAARIVAAPGSVLLVAGAALLLNAGGYLLAWSVGPWIGAKGDRIAMLFTVSKKEFSIAAFVVFASELPPDVALPAVVYAVVQMLTSPTVAHALSRR